MKENFNENKEPHPSENDKKNIFFSFFWQEEEENVNENKEPPLREGEEEYLFIFLLEIHHAATI